MSNSYTTNTKKLISADYELSKEEKEEDEKIENIERKAAKSAADDANAQSMGGKKAARVTNAYKDTGAKEAVSTFHSANTDEKIIKETQAKKNKDDADEDREEWGQYTATFWNSSQDPTVSLSNKPKLDKFESEFINFSLTEQSNKGDFTKLTTLSDKKSAWRKYLGSITGQEKSTYNVAGLNDFFNNYQGRLSTGIFENYIQKAPTNVVLEINRRIFDMQQNYVPRHDKDVAQESKKDIITPSVDAFDGVQLGNYGQKIPYIFSGTNWKELDKCSNYQNLEKLYKEFYTNSDQTTDLRDCYIFVMISFAIWKKKITKQMPLIMLDGSRPDSEKEGYLNLAEEIDFFLNDNWIFSDKMSVINFENLSYEFENLYSVDFDESLDFFRKHNFFPERRDSSIITLLYKNSSGVDSWMIFYLLDRLEEKLEENDIVFKNTFDFANFVRSKMFEPNFKLTKLDDLYFSTSLNAMFKVPDKNMDFFEITQNFNQTNYQKASLELNFKNCSLRSSEETNFQIPSLTCTIMIGNLKKSWTINYENKPFPHDLVLERIKSSIQGYTGTPEQIKEAKYLYDIIQMEYLHWIKWEDYNKGKLFELFFKIDDFKKIIDDFNSKNDENEIIPENKDVILYVLTKVLKSMKNYPVQNIESLIINEFFEFLNFKGDEENRPTLYNCQKLLLKHVYTNQGIVMETLKKMEGITSYEDDQEPTTKHNDDDFTSSSSSSSTSSEDEEIEQKSKKTQVKKPKKKQQQNQKQNANERYAGVSSNFSKSKNQIDTKQKKEEEKEENEKIQIGKKIEFAISSKNFEFKITNLVCNSKNSEPLSPDEIVSSFVHVQKKIPDQLAVSKYVLPKIKTSYSGEFYFLFRDLMKVFVDFEMLLTDKLKEYNAAAYKHDATEYFLNQKSSNQNKNTAVHSFNIYTDGIVFSNKNLTIEEFTKQQIAIDVKTDKILRQTRSLKTGTFGLNFIDQKFKKNISQTNNDQNLFGVKTGSGNMYPHQNLLCELVLQAIKEKNNYFINVKSNLGSGKTTSLLALGKLVSDYNYKIRQNTNVINKETVLMLVCTLSRASLFDIFYKMVAAKFLVKGASTVTAGFKGVQAKQPRLSYFYHNSSANRNRAYVPFDKEEIKNQVFDTTDIICCHPYNALSVIAEKESLQNTRKVILVLDEVDTDEFNSIQEHTLACLLLYAGIDSIVVMSASLNESAPVKFMTEIQSRINRFNNRHSSGWVNNFKNIHTNTTLTDTEILEKLGSTSKTRITRTVSSKQVIVPTVLKQLDDTLIDNYLGYTNSQIIDRVNTDETYKRFVSFENIQKIRSILEINDETIPKNRYNDFLKLKQFVKTYYGDSIKNNIYDASIFYSNIPQQMQLLLREFIPFTKVSYNIRDSEEIVKLCEEIYSYYLVECYNRSTKLNNLQIKFENVVKEELQNILSDDSKIPTVIKKSYSTESEENKHLTESDEKIITEIELINYKTQYNLRKIYEDYVLDLSAIYDDYLLRGIEPTEKSIETISKIVKNLNMNTNVATNFISEFRKILSTTKTFESFIETVYLKNKLSFIIGQKKPNENNDEQILITKISDLLKLEERAQDFDDVQQFNQFLSSYEGSTHTQKFESYRTEALNEHNHNKNIFVARMKKLVATELQFPSDNKAMIPSSREKLSVRSKTERSTIKFYKSEADNKTISGKDNLLYQNFLNDRNDFFADLSSYFTRNKLPGYSQEIIEYLSVKNIENIFDDAHKFITDEKNKEYTKITDKSVIYFDSELNKYSYDIESITKNIISNCQQLLDEDKLIRTSDLYLLSACTEPREKSRLIYEELLKNVEFFCNKFYNNNNLRKWKHFHEVDLSPSEEKDAKKISKINSLDNNIFYNEYKERYEQFVILYRQNDDKTRIRNYNTNYENDKFNESISPLKDPFAFTINVYFEKMIKSNPKMSPQIRRNKFKTIVKTLLEDFMEFFTTFNKEEIRKERIKNFENNHINGFFVSLDKPENAKTANSYQNRNKDDSDKDTNIYVAFRYLSKKERQSIEIAGGNNGPVHDLFAKELLQMVKNHGFNLPQGVKDFSNPKELEEFLSNKDLGEYENYLNHLLKIFVSNGTKLPDAKHKINRCFGDKSIAHRVNRPFEAVLITKSFQTIPVDTIIQMTGRCGRPGLSDVSVVYMTHDCYEKTLTHNEESSVENLAQRYKFYLTPHTKSKTVKNQNEDQIEENPEKQKVKFVFSNFLQTAEQYLN